MSKFIREKSFYKSVLGITIPIALQNLITFGISMADTVMLSKLGELQLTASAQANQPQFVFLILTFGLASGGAVITSQYYGKSDLEAVRKTIGIILRTALIASFAITVAVLIFPEPIMKLYLKDEETISEAVKYLRIVGYSYFFMGVTQTFIAIIRSVEIVKISVFVSLVSFAVNIFLNWLLIFGNMGAPKLGIRGAAVGTLCARISEFIIVLIFSLLIDKKLKFRMKYVFKRDKALAEDCVKYSVPVVINEFAWACGISTQAALLGHLSKDIVAASSIANVFQQLATIIIFGAANASCIVIGKQIGAGNIERARHSAFTIMVWSVVLGVVSSLLIFLTRNIFVKIYNLDGNVKILTENILIITSIIVFFVSISAISIVGVLRGAGDTRFAMKLELSTLWLIAVPLGIVSGYILHLPILLTYAFLKIDEPIKVVIAVIRTMQEKTYKNITRDYSENSV